LADQHPSRGSERSLVVWILRIGLTLATALMAVGVVLAWAEGRLTTHPVTLSQIGSMLTHGRPSAAMEAGILVLLATPMLRVLALIVVFARERDFRFVTAAATVATLLILGVFLGHL
jgi:uncharacterized membrane protein